jgi:tetratricopeptide (TPR) repeat protein
VLLFIFVKTTNTLTIMSQAIYHQDLETLKKYEQILPNHVHLLKEIADCYHQTGLHKLAVTYYKKVAKLAPHDIDNVLQMALAYYHNNQFARALKQFMVVDAHQKLHDIHLAFLGYCYQDGENYAEALKYHLRAFDELPKDVWNLGHIGYCLQWLEDFDQALEYYKIAEKLNPREDVVLMNIGWINLIKGNLQEATNYIKKAHQIDSYDPHTLMNMGHLCMIEKNKFKALFYYKKSVIEFANYKEFVGLMNEDLPYLTQYDIDKASIDNINQQMRQYVK